MLASAKGWISQAKCLAYSPVEAVWNPWDAKYDGKAECFCELLAVVNSSFQVVFDVLILLIPFAIFRTLKLNKSMKSKFSIVSLPDIIIYRSYEYDRLSSLAHADCDPVGICFIYVLGLLSFSMTVVRLHLALDRDASATFVQLREKFTTFSFWTIIETTTALICANLPPMTTMLRRVYSKLVSTVGLSGISGSGSGSRSASGAERKGDNSYLRSLRKNRRRLDSEIRFQSKTGRFNLSWIYGAQSSNSAARSRSTKDQSVSVASIGMKENRPGSDRALHRIGVKTETIIDVEKADSESFTVREDDIEQNAPGAGSEGFNEAGSVEVRRRALMDGYLPPAAESSGKVKTTVTGTELI